MTSEKAQLREAIDGALERIEETREADHLSMRLRGRMGVGRGQDGVSYAAPQGMDEKRLELGEVEMLLEAREQRGYTEGYRVGHEEATKFQQSQREVELGAWVGEALDAAREEALSRIVVAVVAAHDAKKSTRRDIVDAATGALESYGRLLSEMAARARRGELFRA